jgi:ABC-type lipoprotein export system ATPase subunit
MSGTPLIRCVDVARTYGRGAAATVALHGTTCRVQADDRIGLVGPSGSGKSTLLHLMAGLDAPTVGTVEWPAIGSLDRLRAGALGIVFQGPSLLPPLNVLENVGLPLVLAGLGDRDAALRAGEALELLDLGGIADKLPEEISGGQAQRVAVARAIAGEPKVILADEPTGQLDQVNGSAVVDLLLAAADHAGAALVVSTHDPMVAGRMATEWRMADGRLQTNEREEAWSR